MHKGYPNFREFYICVDGVGEALVVFSHSSLFSSLDRQVVGFTPCTVEGLVVHRSFRYVDGRATSVLVEVPEEHRIELLEKIHRDSRMRWSDKVAFFDE